MILQTVAEPAPGKTMLRVYDAGQKGATAFFRNRPLLHTVDELLQAEAGRGTVRVLFHASSIGAEVYSFVIHSMLSGLASRCDLQVSATDVNPAFLQHARRALYPRASLLGMTGEERGFFADSAEDLVGPVEEIRRRVRFLPARSFVDARLDDTFDAVFILNALTYVTPAEQSRCIANVARYNRSLLVACAFHPDSIESDLVAHRYRPITTRIAQIHDGWSERIRATGLPSPGTPEYSWVIPPFSEVPGFEYRYCSIFRKETTWVAGQS